MTTITDNQGTSTRPYLLRALHDWCTDNGFTPYIAVHVDETVQVPNEHVKNNEIVLNVGFEATSGLKLGNDVVEFRARFGGVSRDIVVPVDHVVAIYARENGQGMAFPVPTTDGARGPVGVPTAALASAGAPAAGAAGLAVAAGPRALRLATAADDKLAAVVPAPAAAPAVAPAAAPSSTARSKAAEEPPEHTPPKGPRPSLKRIK